MSSINLATIAAPAGLQLTGGALSTVTQSAARMTLSASLAPTSSGLFIFTSGNATGNTTYSTTTGLATVATAGWYQVNILCCFTASFSNMCIYQYTSATAAGTIINLVATSAQTCAGASLIYMTAGSTFGIGIGNYSGSLNSYSYWTINRLN